MNFFEYFHWKNETWIEFNDAEAANRAKMIDLTSD